MTEKDAREADQRRADFQGLAVVLLLEENGRHTTTSLKHCKLAPAQNSSHVDTKTVSSTIAKSKGFFCINDQFFPQFHIQAKHEATHYCKLKAIIIIYLLLLTAIGIRTPGTVLAANLRSERKDTSSDHLLPSPANLIDPKTIAITSKAASLKSNETKLAERTLLQKILAFQDPKSVQLKRDPYPIISMQETEYNYDDIYLSNGAHESYNDHRIQDFTSFGTYSNDEVIHKGCTLSTVLMDPRMTQVDSQHPMWYTLESVATYAPYSCVILQTASCMLLEAGSSFTNETEEIGAVAQVIYAKSLPMFRRMMERGQVRISILNPAKYHFGRCDNFNPSFAMVNLHYWRDEFIENVDSDNVLVIQDDAVLCHYLDIDRWADFAWVGSVWQPGLCGLMGWWEDYRPNCIATQKHEDWVLHPRLEICKDGYGPNGNGGLSLRKRSWLLRAIEACPWTTYGGIESNEYKMIDHGLPEDQYFAVILNAMNAPFPSVLEASLLFAETQFLEDAEKLYGPFANEQLASAVTNRWGENGVSKYEQMHQIETYNKLVSKPTLSKFEKFNIPEEFSQEMLRTIPIGLHKPW
eukprot:CAMPEP_0172435820 /NCGR_PEP_ID=MMETSP1064-20121228/71396_1 /TAXON_ID=202472 /ORGANISM="Aulacoseira subarctica , Strain CCAP 1002/5" /LENGTH=579 /DNA_ID=CAMNT_0013184183 /DNA_START=139 /DNA_END=1875 /DNA_ORIENTATION=-